MHMVVYLWRFTFNVQYDSVRLVSLIHLLMSLLLSLVEIGPHRNPQTVAFFATLGVPNPCDIAVGEGAPAQTAVTAAATAQAGGAMPPMMLPPPMFGSAPQMPGGNVSGAPPMPATGGGGGGMHPSRRGRLVLPPPAVANPDAIDLDLDDDDVEETSGAADVAPAVMVSQRGEEGAGEYERE